MKRYFTFLALTLFVDMCALSLTNESGVSLQLAQYRASHVSDVRYSLALTLPADASQPYRCNDTVSFVLDAPIDLWLDYQGNVDECSMLVNGRKCRVRYENEHIFLPRKQLRKGRNEVIVNVVNQSSALNRNSDYAYTLFVPDHARSVFPCFDQPDLKAVFTFALQVDSSWQAISNGLLLSKTSSGPWCTHRFAATRPLPTYLFSFTAGQFYRVEAERDGRTMVALYRNNDPTREAQLPIVFDQVAHSLRWLEAYTGIPYPFSHYDFVVLPGYQFGGMEHPGCVQFNDRRIFLGDHPTPAEELSRTSLIAHETAHMWFGDLVTMRWFNDVWTKEVFANFMADKISRELYPDINHDLNFLKAHYVPAMATDRTTGTHPIQQPLENLNQAGLLYGNIIYHKAPIMMRKLEQQMGEEAFQNGLRSYLAAHQYGNATWDDLVAHLHQANPQAGVWQFDSVWVKQAGAPVVDVVAHDGMVQASQHDPRGRGLVWAQKFLVSTTQDERVPLAFASDSVTRGAKASGALVSPNGDGQGYGRFLLNQATADSLMAHWSVMPDVERYAALLTLNENDLMGRIDRSGFVDALLSFLDKERNSLIAVTAITSLARIAGEETSKDSRTAIEQALWQQATHHPVKAIATSALRSVGTLAATPAVVDSVYALWHQGSSLLNDRDCMRIAYHLAVLQPQQWREILDYQRSRLKSEDLRKEFDFIGRACSPDTAVQNALFASLLRPEGRAVEPFASGLLTILNHPAREPQSNRFVKPGLDILQEVQRTGDIFFPLNWCNALLAGHHSHEASEQVRLFLESHHDYPPSLRNKLLQAAYDLLK
ncbi:MAG: ERAP1-like C-terminal domain-containing protein, partial [Muribaculaceae bacterium]|nr:ERAP1-like C-terminal domain-containing protein [Muribaculaceae bacterium]